MSFGITLTAPGDPCQVSLVVLAGRVHLIARDPKGSPEISAPVDPAVLRRAVCALDGPLAAAAPAD
jgi:hypothetical protein